MNKLLHFKKVVLVLLLLVGALNVYSQHVVTGKVIDEQGDTTGIEFVMTALFVVMFLNQWEETKDHGPARVGLICSAICLLIFESSNFIVPAMAFIIICFSAERKFSKKVTEVDAKWQ